VAWGIVISLCAAFAVAAPFFHVQLGIVPAFVPVVHAVVFITALIAAAFLFSQYAVQPQPAFLALASGYLLAGLFAFFQSLAFPNAYSVTGLFGGGPSAAAWLFLLWRTSFPLGILAYALIPRPITSSARDRPVVMPIAITIGCVVTAACSLTWIMTIAEPHLPTLFTDAIHEAPKVHYTTIPAIVLSLAAILLLTRRRTMLDLWLTVTLIAALPDIVVPVSRYALGFYLARSCELISSCAVLIALLTEASTLYAQLARAKALQEHGETERLSSVEAATAQIAHELRQPLSAIRIHANAGARLLGVSSPSVADIGEILNDIDKDACRAGDVIDRIRGSVRRREPGTDALDINAVVSDVVKLLSDDASARGITVVADLSGERLRVAGDRTQITQVLLNLIVNGMNVMETVPAAQRRLTLYTERRDGAAVISVRDCGYGISPENMSRLFEPFFTTRSGGMGLGLSIAQSIVVAHHGRMWAENNTDRGATFHFSMPICAHESPGPFEPADQAGP
jgi:signal transduction histidine kinase